MSSKRFDVAIGHNNTLLLLRLRGDVCVCVCVPLTQHLFVNHKTDKPELSSYNLSISVEPKFTMRQHNSENYNTRPSKRKDLGYFCNNCYEYFIHIKVKPKLILAERNGLHCTYNKQRRSSKKLICTFFIVIMCLV